MMWVEKQICGVVFSRKRSRPHVNPMSVGLTGLELGRSRSKGGGVKRRKKEREGGWVKRDGEWLKGKGMVEREEG